MGDRSNRSAEIPVTAPRSSPKSKTGRSREGVAASLGALYEVEGLPEEDCAVRGRPSRLP